MSTYLLKYLLCHKYCDRTYRYRDDCDLSFLSQHIKSAIAHQGITNLNARINKMSQFSCQNIWFPSYASSFKITGGILKNIK